MTTTGTYAFNPSAGDLILNAFGMIQIRRPMLTFEHLENAFMCSNLLMVEFSNRNPNQWAIELQEVALVEGTPTYNLAQRTVAVAIAYIDTGTGQATQSRTLGPISQADYAALPQKLQEGPPTSYMFNLATPIPTVSLWTTPDGNGPYTLKLQTFRQMQDVQLSGGLTIDSPYRFLDAFQHGLAARLAVYYPPTAPGALGAEQLEAMAQAKFTLAAQRDQEKTPMRVTPLMAGYFR